MSLPWRTAWRCERKAARGARNCGAWRRRLCAPGRRNFPSSSRDKIQLRFLRTHHVGGHFCDEAARREALRFFHQVVLEPGDHVIFASRGCFQANARYFFGSFGRTKNTVRLVSYFLKLGVGGARAERADIHAGRPEFFSNAFGEKQVEGFGGGVNGIEGHGLKGGQRRDDHYV